jgi:hypothetical protein
MVSIISGRRCIFFYTFNLSNRDYNFIDRILKPLLRQLCSFKRGFVILCSFGILIPAFTQTGYFDYNVEIESVYNAALDLRIEESRKQLSVLEVKQPNNLALQHIANYIDFFTLFVTENEPLYKSSKKNRQRRLEMLDKNAMQSDPYYKFVKAEILLHWALVKLKFGDRIGAGSDIYEAYRLLESNSREHPQFIHQNKSLSILYALAESVPTWVRKLIRVNGSLELAKEKIELVYEQSKKNKYFFAEEVAVIYSYLLFYQFNEKEKAWDVLQNSGMNHQKSPMKAFVKSTFAQKLGYNEQALTYAIEAPRQNGYLPFYYLDFLVGKSYLYQLDNQSIAYLKKYTDNFKGQHFIKEAYQKLAWAHFIKDQKGKEYFYYVNLAKQKGSKVTDEDIQAQKEAERKEIPNTVLLQARCLYDGGYYDRALTTLQKNKHLEQNVKTVLEYQYRLGRTLQSLKKYPEAIQYLTKASINQAIKSFMVCNANLQLGMIYELLNKKTLAKKYYNQCLSLSPEEYKYSLHQKARSGLLRLQQN